MWRLRRQQRRLGSKSCVDPWQVSSGFFAFLGDKLASCLVIENFADQAVARYVRMTRNHTPVRVDPTPHKTLNDSKGKLKLCNNGSFP